MGEQRTTRVDTMLRVYVAVLLAVSMSYTAWRIAGEQSPWDAVPVPLVIAWCVAMALANVLPIRWTGWQDPGSVHVGEAFALAPLLVGPSAGLAVLVTTVGHVGGVYLGARFGDGVIRYRVAPKHLLFGFAQQVGAAVAAGHVVEVTGLVDDARAGRMLVPALVAGAVYVLVGDAVLLGVRMVQGHRRPQTVLSFANAAALSLLVVTVLLYPVAVTSSESVAAGLAGTGIALGLLGVLSQSARRQYLSERSLAGVMDFTVRAAQADSEEHVRELLEPAGRYLLDRRLSLQADAGTGEYAVRLRRAPGEPEAWLVAEADEQSQRRLSSGWERDVMQSLAAVTRAALDAARARQRSRRLADHDPLTGLVNRRRFDHDAGRILQRAAAQGGTATLLYLDLNGFKAVNDTVSHDAGDDVLVEAGVRLEATVRPGDLVSRRGGDEFTVLLDGDADGLAERCARALADLPHGVSAAVGVSCFPDDATTLDELLALADQRMYDAKHRHHAERATVVSP